MFIKIQSCFKVVDVTWRYSTKHDEICRRRLTVSEEWLVRALSLLNFQVSIETTQPSIPRTHIGREMVDRQ